MAGFLRPGMTVLARNREAVLDGRNGCRPAEWFASWKDDRGKRHLMVIFPGELQAVKTTEGFQHLLPGMEDCNR